jgi:hypothetical protein
MRLSNGVAQLANKTAKAMPSGRLPWVRMTNSKMPMLTAKIIW